MAAGVSSRRFASSLPQEIHSVIIPVCIGRPQSQDLCVTCAALPIVGVGAFRLVVCPIGSFCLSGVRRRRRLAVLVWSVEQMSASWGYQDLSFLSRKILDPDLVPLGTGTVIDTKYFPADSDRRVNQGFILLLLRSHWTYQPEQFPCRSRSQSADHLFTLLHMQR